MSKRSYGEMAVNIKRRPGQPIRRPARRWKHPRSSYQAPTPMRVLKAPVKQIYSFRQPAYRTTAVQTAGADALGAFNFVLTSVTNYTGFTDLFDVYRVDYMEFEFMPRSTAVDLHTTDIAPNIYTVIDKDDSVTPGTLASLLEYATCERHSSADPAFVRRFKPGTLSGIFDGTSVVAGTSHVGQWIDAAKISIPHYGLKWGITAGAAGQTALQTWDVQLYVGLSFKYIR